MDVTIIDEARANEIEGASIVGGTINAQGQLVLTKGDGSTVNAGKVRPDPFESFPVGSIYISVDPTNPATLLKGGTWTRFANGRVLIGVDENDTFFNSVEKTSGQKTYAMTLAELPSHGHGVTDPGHVHPLNMTTTPYSGGPSGPAQPASGNDITHYSYSNTGTATTGITVNASPAAVPVQGNNLQPGITVYIWKRTA